MRFRPRISILTTLLLMTILGMGLVINQLWREVGPLRATNKRLNEERGTLVMGDPAKLHAIEIPARFAGECLTSYRIYVPPGQTYVAYVCVNDIPKTGVPANKKPTGTLGSLGTSKGVMFATLEPGEHVLTIKNTQYGDKSDIKLICGDVRDSKIDVSAYTPKDRWPTAKPEAYAVFGGNEERETIATSGSQPLVLKRYRFDPVTRDSMYQSWTTIEPDHALDGYILWVERTK